LSGPAARDGLILFKQDKTRSGEKVTVQLGRFSADRLKGGEISLSFVNTEPKNLLKALAFSSLSCDNKINFIVE